MKDTMLQDGSLCVAVNTFGAEPKRIELRDEECLQGITDVWVWKLAWES